uniref:Uncharacterized protein n=1 Tax=Panagrellus redivivus TaxID=6233 RepID=A0A7E4UP01_PANRE
MSNSFDVYLPSSTYGDGNTSSQFTISLPQAIRFESKWQVALTNIIYPHTWSRKGEFKEMYFNILWKNGNADKILVEERVFTANGDEAAEALNAAIREFSDDCKKKLEADYSNVTVQELFFISTERQNLEESVTAASTVKVEYNRNGRFSLALNNEKIDAVYLSKDLAFMLGFKERELHEKTNVANFSPDFSAGMGLFYVYAPGLIEPVRVGDTMAPLLRCFATQGNFDDVVEKSFLDPQYRSLLSKEIREIRINIRASTGKLVPFQFGSTVLVLSFRKCSPF